MSKETYLADLTAHAHEVDEALARVQAECGTASPARRVELKGMEAVLTARRDRLRARIAAESQSPGGILDGVRAEMDQDFGALADFVERQIVGM